MEEIGAEPAKKRISGTLDSFVIWLMGRVAMTTSLVASLTYSMGLAGLALVCLTVLVMSGAIWPPYGKISRGRADCSLWLYNERHIFL